MRHALRGTFAVAACLLVGTTAAGCGMPTAPSTRMSSAGADIATAAGRAAPGGEVAAPSRLTGRVETPDLLVVAQQTLPRRTQRRVAAVPGVTTTLPLALAAAPLHGRTVTLGAVDPSSYRRFTPRVVAHADAVWQRVAEGDVAITPALADDLDQPLGGDLTIGSLPGGVTLRVGARASMPPRIDAVVNETRGRQLGMRPDNALLVSACDPDRVAEVLRRRLHGRATVATLTAAAPDARQTAFLTGGSLADAVGSFTYRYHPDGSVEPDPSWVAANLRTETVPILGRVTCHRVMLPQLRGALQEVVDSGLGDRIDPGDYGGCYNPRFIANDPSRGLSLHTWGIAVDLDVHGNLRGTQGTMDPRVVDIFKRWGFAWGGDWAYTDPMHFELAALVRPR
jgi:hypothetical protein